MEVLKHFGIGNYDTWYHILLEYNWIYGALIFFFVKAYVTPRFKLNFKQDWIHFLPVIIEFTWSNYIKPQNFFWDGTRESLSWLGYWGYVAWMHKPTQYVISAALIIFYIYKSEKLLIKTTSENYKVIVKNTNWIKRVLKIMKYYSIIVIAVVLIDYIFFDYAFNRFYHYPIFLGMALITYWLGIEGFNKKDKQVIKIKSVLDPKERLQLEVIASKLKALMEEEKAYKNPDITLSSLSKSIGEKSYLTTKSLNIVFEKKFNDFINEYRIEELKTLLKDPKNSNYTLLSLAFEAGFNSKASFNRAVKKLTGKSPSALKQE
ncbi:helix-turn-helix domain-containing protein [Winogradskyella sp. PG-2]|uniref:helix-turn-helix domain-containing protein n=1 Tax=Winogradskyella sp. PG-2 TaxID=754409 RepID=UPI00045892A4|nr:helix-turn-helix domain-containing protein [Winogradskyella sp. PG-2]BAO76054.1 transcriptional regulator, AraC family [Winogradskyella sp. PG-2]